MATGTFFSTGLPPLSLFISRNAPSAISGRASHGSHDGKPDDSCLRSTCPCEACDEWLAPPEVADVTALAMLPKSPSDRPAGRADWMLRLWSANRLWMPEASIDLPLLVSCLATVPRTTGARYDSIERAMPPLMPRNDASVSTIIDVAELPNRVPRRLPPLSAIFEAFEPPSTPARFPSMPRSSPPRALASCPAPCEVPASLASPPSIAGTAAAEAALVCASFVPTSDPRLPRTWLVN